MQPNELSGSTLAYIGDAVWSLLVREYLVELGLWPGEGSAAAERELCQRQGAGAVFMNSCMPPGRSVRKRKKSSGAAATLKAAASPRTPTCRSIGFQPALKR